MNYTAIYQRLIERARNRVVESYTESHHILPKCMGGNDDISNLVSLTPEEHFLAHQLLVKMHQDNDSLARAANMMTISPIGKRNNNKRFGWLKRRASEALRRYRHSDESREKIRLSNLGRTPSDETKRKISETSKKRITTEETKEKLRIAIKENFTPEEFSALQRKRASNPKKKKDGYFKPKNENHKENIRLAAVSRPRFACDVCGKLITKANMENHKRIHNAAPSI